MSEAKLAKILLAVIYTLLAGFLLAGCYFLFTGVRGAGLIGLGVFAVGLGFVFLMRPGLFEEPEGAPAPRTDAPKAKKAPKQAAEKPILAMEGASVIRVDAKGRASDACTVHLYSDRFIVYGLFAQELTFPFSGKKAASMLADRKGLQYSGVYLLNDTQHRGTFEIRPAVAFHATAMVSQINNYKG